MPCGKLLSTSKPTPVALLQQNYSTNSAYVVLPGTEQILKHMDLWNQFYLNNHVLPPCTLRLVDTEI